MTAFETTEIYRETKAFALTCIYPYVHPLARAGSRACPGPKASSARGGAMITHHLDTTDVKDIEVGARYKAVWERGTHRERDIRYFRKMAPDEKVTKVTPTVEPAPPLKELISTPSLPGRFTKWAGRTDHIFIVCVTMRPTATSRPDRNVVFAPPA